MRDKRKRVTGLESIPALSRFQEYEQPDGLSEIEVDEWRQAAVTDARASGVIPVIVVRRQAPADRGAFERLMERMQKAASQARPASPSTHGEHQP